MKNGKKRAKKLNIFILTFESSDFYTTFNFKFQINGDIVIKFRLMLIIIWPYFKLSMFKLFKSKFKVSKTHLIGNILLGQYTNNKYVICLVFSFKRLNRKFPDLLVYFWKDIIYFSPCKVYLQLFIHTENFRECEKNLQLKLHQRQWWYQSVVSLQKKGHDPSIIMGD